MNADESRCPDSLTEKVLSAVFEVSNTLGAGFLEKVYERALLREVLRELGVRGIRAMTQAPFSVIYKGHNKPKAEWKRIVHEFKEIDRVLIGVHRR
jgi:GxxExxY protein